MKRKPAPPGAALTVGGGRGGWVLGPENTSCGTGSVLRHSLETSQYFVSYPLVPAASQSIKNRPQCGGRFVVNLTFCITLFVRWGHKNLYTESLFYLILAQIWLKEHKTHIHFDDFQMWGIKLRISGPTGILKSLLTSLSQHYNLSGMLLTFNIY